VVKVTHQITSSTEYPAFVAAIRALFFASYRISQHSAYNAFFAPNSMFMFDTWDDLKNALETNSYWGSPLNVGDNLIRTRTNQRVPSGFYNNAVFAKTGVTTYNDPFGLNQLPGSYFDYNIVLANYVTKAKNIYWAIAGTPTGPTQFNPAEVGYTKPLIAGLQPAEFVGTLGDIEVVDGKPVPMNPNDTYYYLLGSSSSQNKDVRNSNSYYVGLIDPSLTAGKKVGYLRLMDQTQVDPRGFSTVE
jgi:ABC-type molybdate transport system substrate-binding protein